MGKKYGSLVVMSLVFMSMLMACGQIVGGDSQTPTATTLVVPPPHAHRGTYTVQFCNDSSSSGAVPYLRTYFNQANSLIATSLIDSVVDNQDGLELLTTAINSNTFSQATEQNNSLAPLLVDAIPAFPAAPTPIPTAKPMNPVSDSATAVAISKMDSTNQQQYLATVQQDEAKILAEQAAVKSAVNQLINWNPPVDAQGKSILGCLQLARDHFQRIAGTKLLYIASDMVNTSGDDFTQEFIHSNGLKGVIVHVLYFPSPNAAEDHYKRTLWCPYLEKAGAVSVKFDDPQSSQALDPTQLLENDAQTPAQPCPGY